MTKVVLASSSPRRKELLKKVVRDFIVAVPETEEVDRGDPLFVATENAKRKGRAVQTDGIVIACDTIVTLEGEILGKPHTKEKAVEMLAKLSGKRHEVISGLYVRFGDREITDYERSYVYFYPLTEEQIENYVETYAPFDKAGAYGIQDGQTVERYEGSFDNIVGLPVEKLLSIWKNWNL